MQAAQWQQAIDIGQDLLEKNRELQDLYASYNQLFCIHMPRLIDLSLFSDDCRYEDSQQEVLDGVTLKVGPLETGFPIETTNVPNKTTNFPSKRLLYH